MKIDEYITKHTLKLVWSSKEEGFSNEEATPLYIATGLLPEDKNEQYEIYTNEDKTIWVSKNMSKSLFLIRKAKNSGDPLWESGWLDANANHAMLN